MANGIVVPVQGPIESVGPTTLRALQDLVGGLITGVYPLDSGLAAKTSMLANDEGLLIGLPLNRRASALAGYGLVGPLIVQGPIDREGNATDLDPKVEAWIRSKCQEFYPELDTEPS